ncbi:MAG: thiamine phosphate synthase [Acidobacteriota bacterium]
MTFTLPKIYPITDTRISGLSHLEQVRRLILGGATLIQLRDKYAPVGEFYRSAVEAVGYAHQRDVKIIINDRTDIVLAADADGVHLGQDDLSPRHARDLLGPTAIIGFSTHSIEQARDALAMPIDYLAIGPIFATSTKDDADPVVGPGGLRSVRELDRNFPIVAIGGISRDNSASVLSSGADCVAMISDLISDPSTIADRMRELRNL